MLQNPLFIRMDQVPGSMQVEISELQRNDSLQNVIWGDIGLHQFCGSLPDNCSTIKTFSNRMLKAFISAYIETERFRSRPFFLSVLV
jgi:hypothetical protein